MTIQEAVESGQEFKRPKWTSWVKTSYKAICWGNKENNSRVFVTKEDILATDWIINIPTSVLFIERLEEK